MILYFGVKLGYKSPFNTFILLNNLVLALEDSKFIKKKL